MSAIDNFVDDMPMDVNCNDLFDHIDDLLDFPNYYYEDDHFEITGAGDGNGVVPAGGGDGSAAPLPPVSAPLPCKGEECAGVVANAGDKVMQFDELDIAADLEWVSNFMDDATDETFAALNFTAPSNKEETILRTCSPISVLCQDNKSGGGGGGGGTATSSSSSSSSFSYSSGSGGGGDVHHFTSRPPNPIMSAVPARARSKRPRPSTFSARPHVIVLPPSEPECFGESTPPAAERKIKIKIRNPTAIFTGGEENTGPAPVRKCMHCEITKTPQWRAGPMGPKTLCNACGVRYKSGRLFPEYRPAASPTFLPAIHSNSHKKVVEMRIQRPTPGLPSPDSCDLLNYIRRKD